VTAPLLPAGFLVRLASYELASRRPSGVLPGGLHVGAHGGPGTLFRDHRPYAEGDDLRTVDWNAYARHDVLVTKQFEAEEAARLVLLLDASGSMAAGDRERLRAAARGLAVLGAVALGRGDTVVFLSVPGGRRRSFRGRAALPALLEAVGAVEAGGRTDLAAGFREGLAGIRGRALAAVASDFLDPRGVTAGIDFLRRLGWEVRALQPVAPADLEPPPEGRVLLVDAETGEERLAEVTAEGRERLRAAAVRRLAAVRGSLRARGVPWVRIPTDEGSEGALLAALRRGGVLA
jgi:uncharacterized protein (DUF58 family)